MAAKRGLGRGLDSLIPDRSKSEAFINKEETAAKRGKNQVKRPENENSGKTKNLPALEEGGSTPSDASAPSAGLSEAIKPEAEPKKFQRYSETTAPDPDLTDNIASSYASKENAASSAQAALLQEKVEEEAFSAANYTESFAPEGMKRSLFGNPSGSDGENAVRNVRLALVEPNRDQPRKTFDEEKIDELAASIKEHGVIQPLLVQLKDDYYEIIAGERRWRAARKAGLKEIPVIVREYSAQEVVEISLIENIVREDLNPIEEAKAYRRLLDEFGLTQDQVARKVSRSRSAVANFLRLLNLGNEVQDMVITGAISEGHARALLSVPSHEVQKTLADQIVKGRLTVRETEKMVKGLINPSTKEKKQKNPEKEALLGAISEQLRHILGTRVAIKSSGRNRGRIEIEYYSDDDLDRLIDLLKNVQ